ncbi:MAG: DNA-binding response regulator [Bacteroidetes bacterium]|nr:MAG: DNA-binding response regulator [Bacteroidota bacterium]
MSNIHVAIIEDDPEIRKLMEIVIDGSPGFSCFHTYEDAESALIGLPRYKPHLVLMDIHLPGMNGIECTRKLTSLLPDTQIIMLTIQEDDDSVFDSLCAGASGYLIKSTPPAQLMEALEEAHRGGAPMSPQIARKVVRSFRPKSQSPLSERETEVLALLCKGENYRSVADALFVSTNTVKAHIKSIYQKLQVNTRAEAVSQALRDKLI